MESAPIPEEVLDMSQTAMTTPAPAQSPSHPSLEIEGVLPAALNGYFLQVSPHPAGGPGRRPIVSGLRLAGGRAELHRAAGCDADALTAELPALEATTERYRIVVDLPVVRDRAAALLGSPDRYVWQPDRPARIGLVPREPGAGAPRWFPIEPGRVTRIVNAYEEGARVVVDAVRDGRVCRWELDPATGRSRARWLTGAVGLTTVDGARHRNIFATTVDEDGTVAVTSYDLSTWHTSARVLGSNVRASQPVYVPGGWLLVLVVDPVHRRSALLVLDAADLTARPVAIVHLPLAMPTADRAMWTP